MCSISHDYELKLIKTYSEGALRRFRLCSLKWNTLLENLICRGRIGYIHYYGSFIFFKLNFQADWPSKVKYTEGKQYVFLLKKQTTIVTQRQCLRLLNYLKIKYVQMQMVRRHVPMRHIPMATYTHHGEHIPIMGKCLMGPRATFTHRRHLPIASYLF